MLQQLLALFLLAVTLLGTVWCFILAVVAWDSPEYYGPKELYIALARGVICAVLTGLIVASMFPEPEPSEPVDSSSVKVETCNE